MANYLGSNSLDDVMGSGTETAGTPLADRWLGGAGNDTYIYELGRAGGADRFWGGLGRDTVEFRLTAAEWNNATIRANLVAFKTTVENRVIRSAFGELASGTGYPPLNFGINKSLTVLEAENVRVYVNEVLVLGDAAHSRAGKVIEAGDDSSYAAIAGIARVTGFMPSFDNSGQAIPSGAFWNVTSSPTPSYGAFSIARSGQWTYQLDNDNPLTQKLQEGQSLTQVFLVAATLGSSAAFSSVAITIDGTNDKAQLAVSGSDFSVSERGGVANAQPGTDGDGASGLLTVTNIDGAPPATLPVNQPFAATVRVPGVYGDLVVTRGATVGAQTTAVWSYTLRNADAQVQALADKQVVFDVIHLPPSAFDGATSTITLRVAGGDDWAVIGTDMSDLTVTEAGGIQNGQPGDPTAGGKFTQSDPDTAGPLTFAPLTNTPLDALGNRVDTRSAVGKFGNFALDPTTGIWTYALDNKRPATEALQKAAAASTIPAAFEALTVASNSTPDATFTITVNIFGADDFTQSITNIYDPVAGTFVQGTTGADSTAGGQLVPNDSDGLPGALKGTAALPVSSRFIVEGGNGSTPGTQRLAGRYGDFTLDGYTGAWSYARNDSGSPYLDADALRGGQTDTDVMFVSSHDNGASAAVSVVIFGRDDPAVITGTATGFVLEAGGPRTAISVNTINPSPVARGNVQSVDKDAGESGWTTASAGSLVGTYGNFSFNSTSGDWSYALRNLDAQVEALVTGQQVADRLLLTSKDGTSHVISVAIHGANDHALIASSAEPDSAVKEAGGAADGILGDPHASGDLDVTDVDGVGAFTEARFRAVPTVNVDNGLNDLTGTYGRFTFNANTGGWTYTLDNTTAATQALNEGQIVADTMLVFSKDVSASHAVTVTVEGSYDQVDLYNSFTQEEAAGGYQVRAEGWWRNANGALAAVVADYNAAGQLSGSPTGQYVVPMAVALVGVYGQFAVNAAGAWAYTLDNEDPDTLALQSTLDEAGHHVRSAEDFLTVATTTNAAHPAPESYTISVDVFGAYTAVDYRGLAADATTPNLGPSASPGALPAINGNGTITFTVRNFDAGETLRLYGGDPMQAPFPWGTVAINDGWQTTVALPARSASSAPGLINQILYVWDGVDGTTALPALNLGVSIAQGTVNSDIIIMIGNGGLAAGYAGNDRISGTNFGDYVDGGDHDDRVEGGNGNDTLLGGNGDDELLGQEDNDRLEGGAGNDTLVGGDGRDILVPGQGRDRLTGGPFSDLFVFGSGPFGPSNSDVVTDYSVADDGLWFDQDLLLTTGYGPAALAGNDWFNTATASDIAAQRYEANDRFIFDSHHGLLYYDPDGSAGSAPAALVAEFTGSPALVAEEFVFGAPPSP